MTPADDELEKVLGPLEAQVMLAMWAAKRPVSVRDLLERINEKRAQQLAYTTVMTVMSRLVEKDVLRRRKEGRSYVYEPVANDPAGIAVRGVMRDFGDAAMAQFVEEAKSDPKTLRRLRRLLSEEK